MIDTNYIKFTIAPTVALVVFLILLYRGTKWLRLQAESKSRRYKFNFTISNFQELKIVTLGPQYRNADYEFFLNLFSAPLFEEESYKLLEADQLLIDFTNCHSVETMGPEFLSLHFDYLNLKGKKPLFSGISGNLKNTLVGLLREDYQELAKFDTKEEAIQYYLESKKNYNA